MGVVDVEVRRERSGEHAHQPRIDREIGQDRVQVGRAERVHEPQLGVVVLLGQHLDDLADARHLVGREHAGDVRVAAAIELFEDLPRARGIERLARGAHGRTA
jgi:hypothetical protein